MEWTSVILFIAIAIWAFAIFGGPQAIVKTIMDGKVKIAEAEARTEEARLERARLEKINH